VKGWQWQQPGVSWLWRCQLASQRVSAIINGTVWQLQLYEIASSSLASI